MTERLRLSTSGLVFDDISVYGRLITDLKHRLFRCFVQVLSHSLVTEKGSLKARGKLMNAKNKENNLGLKKK